MTGRLGDGQYATGTRVTARSFGLAVCAVVLLSIPQAVVLAHHAITAKFDTNSSRTLEGIVTKIDWRNPHAHIFMNVGDRDDLENWAVELESPIALRESGWAVDTLRPGDEITVMGITARNGTRQIWGESVVETKTGRRVLFDRVEPPPAPLEPRPTPRWSDGRPALGAVPGGADGYWSFPSQTALVEEGAQVTMNADGLLENLDDASRVAPLQDWALALYRFRQGRELQDDPLFINCKPPGGPRAFQSDLGVKFVEDKAGLRIFLLFGSGNHNYKIMYLDGREPVGQVRGDDDNPLFYGRSVGKWEGDTLVIETSDFNEDFWFTNGGLPHTNQLRLVERFSRPDYDTLRYEVTIDDPGAYTRPWSSSWTLRWVGGEELPVHFCQENRP